MSLQETKVIDKIEVLENGIVQVREALRILRDGAVIAESFTRWLVVPGDDYSVQPNRVAAICAVVQTPEVVAAYQAEQARLAALAGAQ